MVIFQETLLTILRAMCYYCRAHCCQHYVQCAIIAGRIYIAAPAALLDIADGIAYYDCGTISGSIVDNIACNVLILQGALLTAKQSCGTLPT